MISQPMKGKSEEQIRNERKDVARQLELEGHEVIDTIFADEPPTEADKALFYLSKSIEAMSKVEAIVFIAGWQDARGCRIEHEIALKYNKYVKEL